MRSRKLEFRGNGVITLEELQKRERNQYENESRNAFVIFASEDAKTVFF